MKKAMYTMALSALLMPSLTQAACNSRCQAKVESTIKKMSLQEKIGQMLLVGFRGQKIDRRHQVVKDITKHKVGSVILFEYDAELKTRARNIGSPAQLKKLTADLQSYAKVPLLISIDEEGGLVHRLKKKYGFKTFPSAQHLGERDDLSYTRRVHQGLAKQLKSHGVNMNFAPVVDVNVNTKNPVIGKLKRSFSTDEQKVAEHAEQAIKGHQRQKVFTALKHFPGHGSSTKDSHKSLVDVTDTWEERELYPFEYLVNEGLAQMIMTAHVFQRHLDPDYPATLSKEIIGGVLRQQIGFNGVVISDDMNMAAIHQHYKLNKSIPLAINAGVDILLFGNNIHFDKDIAAKAQKIIQDLVKRKVISTARIEQSVRRVLRLKYSI